MNNILIMKKALALILAATLIAGFAAAQGYDNNPDNDQKPENITDDTGQLGDTVDNLPSQASETATQVLQTIGNGFEGLGERLSSLFS